MHSWLACQPVILVPNKCFVCVKKQVGVLQFFTNRKLLRWTSKPWWADSKIDCWRALAWLCDRCQMPDAGCRIQDARVPECQMKLTCSLWGPGAHQSLGLTLMSTKHEYCCVHQGSQRSSSQFQLLFGLMDINFSVWVSWRHCLGRSSQLHPCWWHCHLWRAASRSQLGTCPSTAKDTFRQQLRSKGWKARKEKRAAQAKEDHGN